MPVSLANLLPDALPEPSNDVLLDRFLEYTAARNLALYPAQEAAILELFDDKNVILNTPTGSGKSLVATALHFASIARGRRSIYTCPIKALVNEKWMALCREFGPEQGRAQHRRRVRQSRRADPLLHGGNPGQHRPARRRRRPTFRTSSWTNSITTPTASAAWRGRCRC